MSDVPTFTPINATLGAVVTDVDLNALSDVAWAGIHTAFLRYGVLVFPRSTLGPRSAMGVRPSIWRPHGGPGHRAHFQPTSGRLDDDRQGRGRFACSGGNEGLAYRQHLHAARGQGRHALGVASAVRRRPNRVRRHARRLGRPRCGDARETRRPLGLPLAVSLAGQHRLHPPDRPPLRLPHQRRAAATIGEAPSGNRAQSPSTPADTPTAFRAWAPRNRNGCWAISWPRRVGRRASTRTTGKWATWRFGTTAA